MGLSKSLYVLIAVQVVTSRHQTIKELLIVDEQAVKTQYCGATRKSHLLQDCSIPDKDKLDHQKWQIFLAKATNDRICLGLLEKVT